MELFIQVFRDYFAGLEMRVLYVTENLQPSFPSPSLHLTRLGPEPSLVQDSSCTSHSPSQTEILEREGRIRADHVGKPGTDALRQRCELRSLSALSKGGRESLWGVRLRVHQQRPHARFRPPAGRRPRSVSSRRHSKPSPDSMLASQTPHKVFLGGGGRGPRCCVCRMGGRIGVRLKCGR